MNKRNLYNLKSVDGEFRITKFDSELNVESSYLVNDATCECPQGHKPTCRHRRMLPLMLDRMDSPWFYCFEDKTWHDPTNVASAASEAPIVEAPTPKSTPPSTEATLRRRI